MTNSEKALHYLYLQKREGIPDQKAIKDTAAFYDISEQEMEVLMNGLQNTPQYNEGIIKSIWKPLGFFVFLIFIFLLLADLSNGDSGGSTFCKILATLIALLGLGTLIGIAAPLSEIKPVEKEKEAQLSTFRKACNKVLRLGRGAIPILVVAPVAGVIVTSLTIAFVRISQCKQLHMHQWQLHQGLVLTEDCKRITKNDSIPSDHYLLITGKDNTDYTWNSDDHYFTFNTAAPDKYLKKGDTVGIYTSPRNSQFVYDITVKSRHLLNLQKRNELAAKEAVSSARMFGGVFTLMVLIITVFNKGKGEGEYDDDDETHWPPPGYKPDY